MTLTLAAIPLEQLIVEGMLPEPGADLVRRMETYGQLEPVLVKARREGGYRLLNGRRRLAAARKLGWSALTAVVEPAGKEGPPDELKTILLNTGRRNLGQLYLARQIRAVLQRGSVKQTHLARELRMCDSALSEMQSVLDCPDLVHTIEHEGLGCGAARALARLPTPTRKALLKELLATRARAGAFPSVREIEEQVRLRQGKRALPRVTPEALPALVEKMRARGLPVEVRTARGKQTRLQVTLTLAEDEEEGPAAPGPGSPGTEEPAPATDASPPAAPEEARTEAPALAGEPRATASVPARLEEARLLPDGARVTAVHTLTRRRIPWLEPRGEVAEREWLLGRAQPAQRLAAGVDVEDHLDHAVDVALGVGAAGEGDADEVPRGGRVGATGRIGPAEHHRADLDVLGSRGSPCSRETSPRPHVAVQPECGRSPPASLLTPDAESAKRRSPGGCRSGRPGPRSDPSHRAAGRNRASAAATR